MSTNEKKVGIVQAITSPLGFFALALLIVEAFLSTVLIFSNLDSDSKFWGMLIGAALFVVVIVFVFLLVWFKPKYLTYGENSHLHEAEMENNWGTSDDPEAREQVEKEIPVEQADTAGTDAI